MLKLGSEIDNSGVNPLQRKLANKKKISKDDILRAYKKKLSLLEISNLLNISELTVATYFERLLKKNIITDISFYITNIRFLEIEEILLNCGTTSIKKIINRYDTKVTEVEIRLVRGALIGKSRSDFDFSI